jgi:hypothetical protein
MQTEDVELEFPVAAIDDVIAGTPGSEGAQIKAFGAAHTTVSEEAAAPCDMSGNTSSFAPGEDPAIQDISQDPNTPQDKWSFANSK